MATVVNFPQVNENNISDAELQRLRRIIDTEMTDTERTAIKCIHIIERTLNTISYIIEVCWRSCTELFTATTYLDNSEVDYFAIIS